MVGIVGEFFLVSVSHETKHENSSKNSGGNSEQNSGQNSGLGVPQKEVGKRSSITFFIFSTLSVTFWPLFLMLLSLFLSLFCPTPFAGLFLWQGEGRNFKKFGELSFCNFSDLTEHQRRVVGRSSKTGS